MTDLRERIEQFVADLNIVERAYIHEHYAMLTPAIYSLDTGGRRWLRVVRDNGTQRFVEMFIDSTNGDVYYPAGWQGPAKPHVRGNVATDNGAQTLLARKWLNHHGYLYLDSIKASDAYMREVETKTILSLLSPVWL